MRLGRPKSTKQIVFSLEKVDPSSSSTENPTSSSTENPTSSSSTSCQINPSQVNLEITSGTVSNGAGITFASSPGNKFYYDSLSNYDGLPDTMRIYVSGTEVAVVTWNQPFAGTPFVLELFSEGSSNVYCGNIVSGEINF